MAIEQTTKAAVSGSREKGRRTADKGAMVSACTYLMHDLGLPSRDFGY